MDVVVFIHGFAAHWGIFAPCAIYLRHAGYKTQFWTYPTLTQSIEESAERFSTELATINEQGIPFHIVAHSMGSIVTRMAISHTNYAHLRKIVFLAPPIKGVPAARRAPRFVKEWIPAMRALSDGAEGIHHTLHQQNPVPTLVVAARYDAIVPLRNTHLSGQAVHETVLATHNSLLIDPRVLLKIRSFLR